MFDINEYIDYYQVDKRQISDTVTESRSKKAIKVMVDESVKPETKRPNKSTEESRQAKAFEVENIEHDARNIKESTEKKSSVYDYLEIDQYQVQDQMIKSTYEPEAEPLEIIPENLDKLEEFKNSYVDQVNFDQAPSVKLYDGPVASLTSYAKFRVPSEFDYEAAMKLKNVSPIHHIQTRTVNQTAEAHAHRQLTTERHTNTKITPKGTLTHNTRESLPTDFDMSHPRFNEELLSQLPTDPFRANKHAPAKKDKAGDSTLKSNFTYGEKSKSTNQFKSELIGEPLPDETRVRRKSHKKKITKEEYERILRENKGETVTKTVRRISSNQANNRAWTQVQPNQLNSANPAPVKTTGSSNTSKPASRYLKLVIDEHGQKRYQMVSVNSSPRNESQKVLSSKDVTRQESQRERVYRHQRSVSPQRFNSPGAQQNVIQFTAKRQGSYNTVTGVQTGKFAQEMSSKTQTQTLHMNTVTKVTQAENKYKTYTYSGASRRFGEQTETLKEKQAKYYRSPSPGRGLIGKSPKKVTIYRNGVKISEQVYQNDNPVYTSKN